MSEDNQTVDYNIENVDGYISSKKLEDMLEEVINFEVELAIDPTSVNGSTSKYLQGRLSTCRSYINRTLHYLQLCKRYEKNVKKVLKLCELDLEFKQADLLSEDPHVKSGPSIKDRMALVHTKLKNEIEAKNSIAAEIQNLEDIIKLLKTKYDDLKQSNADIKLQRQIIKDEIDAYMGGEESGYNKPQTDGRGFVENNMKPPVKIVDINPSDLLGDNNKAETIPQKEEPGYKSISDFFDRKNEEEVTPSNHKLSEESPINTEEIKISYSTLLDE